jgi:beta-galactosidase
LGEARAYPSRGSSAGLLDIAGFRKPNSYMRASLWSDKPMCYLGTYSMERGFMRGSREGGSPLWNYESGQKVRVVCNTNCAETKLLLNGKQVGEIQKLDKTKESISWEVPYEAGKLEAVGMNEGKEVCRYAIQTAGRPAAINVSVESEPGDEVQQIAVQIVDEQGVPVLLADDEVTCLVEGSARVLGMESGDMNTTDNLRDRSQRVYKGRLLAYVRNQSGERTIVRFTAPWLKAAEVVIGK